MYRSIKSLRNLASATTVNNLNVVSEDKKNIYKLTTLK